MKRNYEIKNYVSNTVFENVHLLVNNYVSVAYIIG